MRITNKIMQNNSLYNINNNKILQDKLSTQMSTQKAITRPSDDPVVAIRALRLRSSVSELTQFYKKNAPDAQSWIEVTGKGLSTVTDILTDMNKQANKGANKDYTSSELSIIVKQLQSLRDEFYATGNLDYAGRYVFTGYRTDTTMTFTKGEVEETKPDYVIHEQGTMADFNSINYTYTANLDGMNAGNYDKKDVIEQDVVNGDIHRIRLAYNQVERFDGIQLVDKDGKTVKQTYTADTVSTTADPDPYKTIQDANKAGTSKIVFVPETGEVLFSDKAYEAINTAAGGISGSETEIRMNYKKSKWEVGDLRPEHYFACEGTTTQNGVTKKVSYNEEYLEGKKEKQSIEYDVGYNQKIEVNTTAEEVFSHRLDRDVDDLVTALASLEKIESTRTDLKKVLSGLDEGTADYKEVQTKLEAADKAFSYIRENIHDLMQHTITSTQQYLDDTNVAITDNGTRESRLDLISNRLMDQQTTFKTLQSENEDVDIADVTIQLTSTKLTYDAALMATGKIMQTSLMNYI
mgnify:CR=1 FL=1